MIFTSGKAKTDTCNRFDTAANIFIASIVVLALQFLLAEKREQIYVTGLT